MPHSSLTHSKKLHLGCGLIAPESWLNVDGSPQVILAHHPRVALCLETLRLLPSSWVHRNWPKNIEHLNLSRPLPYPDASFDAIYTSHLIEHLYRDDASSLLSECFRILEPGGTLRIVVPDLESLIQLYLQHDGHDDTETAADMFMRKLNTHSSARPRGLFGLFRKIYPVHQHKWMYNAASLKRLMTDTGFREASQKDTFESRINDIQTIENPDRINNGEGIAVEAIK